MPEEREREPFWRTSKEEAEPCSRPGAAAIIDTLYDTIHPRKRAGTFEELQFNDLMTSHVLKDHCSACLRRIEEKGDSELEWEENSIV